MYLLLYIYWAYIWTHAYVFEINIVAKSIQMRLQNDN
jgi:hypothetical protein